ncbi:WhiB family transcriptional regulator [Nocardia rhizosphaerae]|uniref:WhiB family transcriptional regulator n=1 Tax=Nocardia rhizosphaerae TaxID=1691571 RepID=A0ABV8L438_9NOCA
MARNEWIENANCRAVPPDMFFPSQRTRKLTIARARGVCAHCPVIRECARFVLDEKINCGIYAGVLLGYGADARPAAIEALKRIVGADDKRQR